MTAPVRCEFCRSSLHVTPLCPSRLPKLSPFAKAKADKALQPKAISGDARL